MARAACLDGPEPSIMERGRQVGGRERVQKGAVAGRVAERFCRRGVGGAEPRQHRRNRIGVERRGSRGARGDRRRDRVRVPRR